MLSERTPRRRHWKWVCEDSSGAFDLLKMRFLKPGFYSLSSKGPAWRFSDFPRVPEQGLLVGTPSMGLNSGRKPSISRKQLLAFDWMLGWGGACGGAGDPALFFEDGGVPCWAQGEHRAGVSKREEAGEKEVGWRKCWLAPASHSLRSRKTFACLATQDFKDSSPRAMQLQKPEDLRANKGNIDGC